MDIRAFFGKASKPGKSKAAPSAAANNDGSSSSSSNPVRSTGRTKASKKKVASKRRHIDLDEDSTTDEDAVVHVQEPSSSGKKNRKKQIVLDDDSSTDDDGVVPVQRKRKTTPEKTTDSSVKKLKSPNSSSPKQNLTEISAQDFFSKPVSNNTGNNKDEQEKSPVIKDAPLEVNQSSPPDSSPEEQQSKKRERPAVEAEKDTAPSESPMANKTSASPVTPPSAASTPAKKKKRTKASPASKKKAKEPLLQPTELASFSTDEAIPECLSGITFVFSGVLPNLAREAAQDFVKILGGRVTGAVSGRTHYLVVGDILEDGRAYTEGSKYKKAMELNVIIVKGEEQLYGLAKLYSDKARAKDPSLAPVSAAGVVSKEVTKKAPPTDTSATNNAPKPKPSVP